MTVIKFKQIKIIKLIKQIDSEAKFLLIARIKSIQKMYENINGVNIKKEVIEDDELKTYYEKAKAVILFQDNCLASNVVLESIAMCVPIITNLVGDIGEYLYEDYPLYIEEGKEEEKLSAFCLSDTLQNEIIKRFKEIRNDFDWPNITKATIDFIEQH